MSFVYLEDGSKIHYISAGNGESIIIFIHGNLGNTIWWEKTLSSLPIEYTAYAIDLPGNGYSPETGERHTMDYFSSVIEMFVKSMMIECHYLVGHSMGGGVSQLYTLNNPDKVLKLVLLNSMAADGFHVIFDGGLYRMKSLMENKDLFTMAIKNIAPMCRDEVLLSKAIDLGFKSSSQVFLEQPITMHEANWFNRLQEINCPVLSLYGAEDKLVPLDGCERTAQAITNCEFKLLDHSGHCPMVEVPDVFNWEIFNFFREENPNLPLDNRLSQYIKYS